jgi:hypothetical protein
MSPCLSPHGTKRHPVTIHPQLPQTPVSNWPFYQTASIELLIAFLFVFVSWLVGLAGWPG